MSALIPIDSLPSASQTKEAPPLLSVLNIGHGDLEIRLDSGDEADVAKAKQVIEDMLARGYTILVKDGAELRKVVGFDPVKELYFVRDPEPAREATTTAEPTHPAKPTTADVVEPKKRGRKKGIPLRSTQATGIGPTAGG